MNRWMWTGLSIALCSLLTGCQSGAGYYGACPNGVTIAPPPTYSINIPSTAKNQPYYSGDTGNNGGLLNPNSQSPAGGQPGWKSVDGGLSNNAPVGSSVVESRTQAPGLNNGLVQGNGNQSFRDSVNYRTTSVDESQDDTRLAVTDASGVRAPTSFSNTGAVRNQPGGSVGNGQPLLVPGTFVTAPQPRMINGQVEYYNSQPVVNNYGAYPVSPANYGNVSQPQVLAQSTTTYDPANSPSHQNVWRDRNGSGTLR